MLENFGADFESVKMIIFCSLFGFFGIIEFSIILFSWQGLLSQNLNKGTDKDLIFRQ